MPVQTPSPNPQNADRELTTEERLELEAVVQELARRGAQSQEDLATPEAPEGPQTDDELWDAIYHLTNYQIPRVAVCENHVAPFTIFADLYFNRRNAVLMIGNRGGGKTTLSGFLHGAKCRWNAFFKSALVGANEPQGNRGYAEFKRFISKIGDEVVDTLRKETRFSIGSMVEVLIGTIKQMNGPHPHLAQFDELELSTMPIFEEFLNMAQGDDRYSSQNLLSTTRKYAFGIIQGLVRAAQEAVKNGDTPEWDVMIFCVFETMRQVPNCRTAPENEGRPEEELCKCHLEKKGEWDDGTKRTFASVCNGRAYRARGFIQLADVIGRFKKLSREVWEAQQECLRPDPSDLIHRWFRPHYILSEWFPYPELGSVYRSWDWGGDNPHSVHWTQRLDHAVEHEGRVIPEGSMVTFDEMFYSGGGYTALGERVLKRTKEWQEDYGFKFKIRGDFCDPAGFAAKQDVKKWARDNGFEEPDFTSRPAERIESIKKHREWGEEGMLWIVGPFCPNLCEEYAVYHRKKSPDGKNPSEDAEKIDDHAMDDQRYLIWNLYKMGFNATSEIPASAMGSDDPRLGDRRPPMMGANPMNKNNSPVGSSAGGSYLNRAPHGGQSVRGGSRPSVRRGT